MSGNGMGDFISGIIAFISVLVILVGTYMMSSEIKNCKWIILVNEDIMSGWYKF